VLDSKVVFTVVVLPHHGTGRVSRWHFFFGPPSEWFEMLPLRSVFHRIQLDHMSCVCSYVNDSRSVSDHYPGLVQGHCLQSVVPVCGSVMDSHG
jgi:hypothetical protein